MRFLVLACYLLVVFIQLSDGDETFSRAMAAMVSRINDGKPITEEQLEKLLYYHDDTEQSDTKAPPISTYANPKVITTSGEVEGTTNDLAHAFYEIPYAEPPVGELRFQPPQPISDPQPINGKRRRGKRCHQIEGSCLVPLNPICLGIPMDEDCLVLNVYSPVNVGLTDPDTPPTQSLPVLVFIHGGAFVYGRGTSEGYEGSELAAVTNMVIVTINYRLGALGFLVHKQNGYPDIKGNQGLKDQQLALQWVQDNIANFGGDKDQVTIAGNSAGAQSVMFHTLSSISKPLYNNAIQQSNPAVFSYQSPEDSLEITNYLLTSLRCNESLSERECLMNASPYALTKRQLSVMLRSFLNRDTMGLIEPFRPIIDGVEFTDHPIHLYRDGNWNSDKDMIVGVATEELDTIKYLLPPGLEYSKLLFEIVNYYIFGTGTTDKVVKKYDEAFAPGDGENWADTFSKEMTHLYFICPSRALARYASSTATESAKVYFYANDHGVLDSSCVARNESDDCYYATHGSEVRFLFRTKSNPTADDISVENQLSTYWGSFARTGTPANGLQSSLGDFTDWPIYSETTATAFSVIPKNESPLEVYAKLLPHLYKALSDELGSGEFLPNSPWENILIKAPNSEVIMNFQEDICEFWDSVGYYMDPIPLPTTTTPKATPNTEATAPTMESTTSRAINSRPSSAIYFIGGVCLYILNKSLHDY